MWEENKVSLEDTSDSKYLWELWAWVWQKVEDYWNFVNTNVPKAIDYVTETAKELPWDIYSATVSWLKSLDKMGRNLPNVLSQAPSALVDFFTWEDKTLYKKIDTMNVSFSDDDKKMSDRLNKLNAFDMAVDMWWALKDAWMEWIFWSELSDKLKAWVDEKWFLTSIESFNKDITDKNNKISQILNDIRFSNFVNFNDNVLKEYLRVNNIQEIKDINDFNSFKQSALNKLNPIQSLNIINQSELFQKETANIQNEIKQKEDSLKLLITNSVEWWEEEYNNINKKRQDKNNWSEFLSLMNDLTRLSTDKVDKDISELWIEKISDYALFNEMKDEVISDLSTDKKYELSLLWMKDLPWSEELALKMKAVNNVTYNFNIDYVKNFINARWQDENKWLTDLELKKKVLHDTYIWLNEEQKDLFRTKQSLITSISRLREAQQFTDNVSKWTLKWSWQAVLDLVSFWAVTVSKIIDNIFDYNQEVPNYIKSETRNIVYSWEWMMNKTLSVLTYNPDVALELFVPMKALWLPMKWLDAFTKATNNKIMTMWVKFWFWEWKLRFIWKWIEVWKTLTASQIYWAWTDPILDNWMEEAPTKASETFNQLTNVLFDVTPMVMWKAYKESVWFWTQTMNWISYKYLMSKDKKESVDLFIDAIKTKTWKDITWWEAKTILDNWINWIYKSLYNPIEVAKILTDKSWLYKFVWDNITKMDELWINEVLTDKWLALRTSPQKAIWISNEQILDIEKSFDLKMSNEPDLLRKQFNSLNFDTSVSLYKDALNPDIWMDWVVIKKEHIDNPEFIALKSKSDDLLKELKDIDSKELFTVKLKEYKDTLEEAYSKFSNSKFRRYIDVIDTISWNDVRLYIDDLNKLEWKDYMDLVKEWFIEVKQWDTVNKYVLKNSQQERLVNTFNDVLHTHWANIKELSSELWIPEYEIKKQLVNLLFTRKTIKEKNVSKVSIIKQTDTYEQATEKMLKLSKLMNNILQDYLWLDKKWVSIINKNPLFINKEIKVDEKTWMVSWQSIAAYMEEHDSYINLSYWLFKVDKKEWWQNAMYLYLWKKVLKNDSLRDAANWIENWKYSKSYMDNSHRTMKDTLLEMSYVDWKFDIERWIEKLDSVYSIWMTEEVEDLFIKWNINKDKLSVFIDNMNVDIKDKTRLESFVLDLFKWSDENTKYFIWPMIKNIVYQYNTNYKLIDELIKRNSTWKFSEILSNIILWDDIIKKIADRITWSKWVYNELKDNFWLDKRILETRQSIIDKKINLLNTQIDSISETIKTLKEYETQYRVWLEQSWTIWKIRDEIIVNENKLTTYNSEIKSLRNFDVSKDRLLLTSYIEEKLKSKANNFSILINFKDTEIWKEINILNNTIKSTWEQIDFLKSISNLSASDKKWINKIIKILKTWWNVEDIKTLVNDSKLKPELTAKIMDFINTNHKWIEIFDMDDIEKELKNRYNNEIVLDSEELKVNNPIEKWLSWFLNRNEINQDDEFTWNILKYFAEKDWVDIYNTDSFWLYKESTSFQNFVNSLLPIEVLDDWKFVFNINWKKVIKHWISESHSNYKKVLTEILSKKKILINDSNWIEKDMTDEIILWVINNNDIKNRFVALTRLKDYNLDKENIYKERVISYRLEKKEENSSFANIKNAPSKIEQVLQLDNMEKWWMDFVVLNSPKFWNMWYFKWNYVTNIKSIINWENKKLRYLITKAWSELEKLELNMRINRRPWEALDIFSKMFNWNITEQKFTKLHYDTQEYIEQKFDINAMIKWVWLQKQFNEWYYFAWSFWDKDSMYQLYKAPDDLINHFWLKTRTDINKLSWIMYKAHYAYSNWYITKDIPYNTFNELIDFINSKAKTLNDVDKIMTQLYKEDEYWIWTYILNNKTIKKREAFNMSNYSIATNDIRKIDWLVVQVQTKNNPLWKSLNEILSLTWKEFDNFIYSVINSNNRYADVLSSIMISTTDEAKRKVWVEEVFYKDLTDWTAWSTRDIWESLFMHEWFWIYNEVKKLVDDWYLRQIKSHVFWDININWKQIRYWWKHLVNIPNKIVEKVSWKELSMTYVTWIESAKLKWPMDKLDKNDQYTITIDWVDYTVIWKIPWMDMSFYKNASSTLLKEHLDMTIWSSIQSTLSAAASKETEILQKNMIDDAFKRLFAKIQNPKLKLDAYSAIDKTINKIVNKYAIWLWTSSILWSKLNAFTTEISRILDKPKEQWQSMFIRQSSLDIHTNEVIMSEKSELVKQIRNEVSIKKYWKTYEELDKKEKIKVDWNLFTVWYRFPVPSKYNIWAYRILIWEKLAKKNPEVFWEFEYMWSKQVVTHPIATYLKLQWDNDWDHIFFISMLWDWWDIIARDILPPQDKPLLDIFWKDNITVTQLSKTWIDDKSLVRPWLIHDINITDQVKKEAVSKEKINLLDSRISAIDWKSRIWMVSATGRTLKILGQMLIDSLNNKDILSTKLIKEKHYKWNSTKEVIPFESVLKDLNNLNTEKDFYSYYDSLLQLTIDFWWWDKIKFDEFWFIDILWRLMDKNYTQEWIDRLKDILNFNSLSKDITDWDRIIYQASEEELTKLNKMFDIMDNFITPMSTWYWATNITSYNIDWIMRESKNISINNYYPLIWSVRNVYDYTINKYWEQIVSLNQTQDVDFLINKILKKSEYKWLRDFWKRMNDIYKKNWWHISNDNKLILFNELNTYLNKYPYWNIVKVFNDWMKAIKIAENEADKANIRKELFTEENIKIVNSNRRDFWLTVLLSYLRWENKIVNFLTNNETLDFIKQSDDALRDKLYKNFNEDVTMKEYLVMTNEEKLLMQKQKEDNIKILKKEISSSSKKNPDDLDNIEKLKSKIEYEQWKLDEMQSALTDNEIIDSVENIQWVNDEIITYNLPEIKLEIEDLNYRTSQDLLYWIANDTQKAFNLIRLKTSTFLFDYVPEIMTTDSNLRYILNSDKSISNAIVSHMYLFWDNSFIKNKKSLSYILKQSWIENLNDVYRKIQYSMLDYWIWIYFPNTVDIVINSMKRFIDDRTLNILLENEHFKNSLWEYIETVIVPVSNSLNKIEKLYWYKVHDSYKWEKRYSLINDVLEAHKSDSQLALKINWINSRKEFVDLIRSRWQLMTWTVETMVDALFKSQQSSIDKVIWFLKSVHYTMTYWSWSTLLTQNGLISWLSQLYPNYIELKAYYSRHIWEMWMAQQILEQHWILKSEDVKMFATWFLKDLNWSWSIDDIYSRVLGTVRINNPKWNKVISSVNSFVADKSSLVHLFVTNPLAAWDLPVEHLRKLVAIQQTMTELWIKSKLDLDKKILLHWDKWLWLFRSKVNINFAESGWWVVSSSRIYRDTVFHHLDNYFDNFIFRAFTQVLWYLMWWSYHKLATLAEKEWALLTWLTLMFSDFSSAKLHFHDWYAYHNMLAKQLMYVTWIYLKTEKYEKDNNNRLTLEKFQRVFNNSIVSIEILLWKYFDSYWTAKELWASNTEAFWYSSYVWLRTSLRLFKQAEFVTTMYNHYRMNQVTWKEDMYDSFKYAVDQHYTTYQRMNWLKQASDIYNSLQSNWITWHFLLWWITEEEELYKKLIAWKIYNSYDDKWVVGSLMNYINILKNTDWNSWFNITAEMWKEFKDRLMEDKEIRKLVHWWQLWNNEWDYNLSTLIWGKWVKFTEEQFKAVWDLYRDITSYSFKINNITWKVNEKSFSKNNILLSEAVNDALKKEWKTITDLIILKERSTRDFLKVLAKLESNHNISTPMALSVYFETLKEVWWSNLYKQLKRKWTDLEYANMQRDILLKNQELLNINKDTVFNVLDMHARNYHWDLFDKYKKVFKDSWFAETAAIDYLNKAYLIWQVVSKDTSVTKLNSKYTLALKWVWDNEISVKIVNNFLHWLYDLPYLSQKEKLANAASAIMWLDKSTLWVLRNNEEFNKLSTDAKKLISNWMYKVSKDSIAFDSTAWLNELNKTAWSWNKYSKWKYIKPYYPKFKSEAFSWARPNFSKQFEPIRQFMPQALPYIDRDHEWYLRNNNPNRWSSIVNPLKSNIMKEYSKLLIEQLYYWYQSTWIIKPAYDKKEEFSKNKIILNPKAKMKKQNSWKKSEYKWKSKIKKFTRWLNPNLELWTQIES